MAETPVILTLLAQKDWGEYQLLIDAFRAWAQYPLFLQTIEHLNRPALFQSDIHGPGHVERTVLHGALCAQSELLSPEDTRLLLLACAYHDTGRQNDSYDVEHGYRASLKIGRLTGCTGEALTILKGAVDAHARDDRFLRATVERYHPAQLERALTITTLLKDADGLDRVRIWDLNPAYLRRESSRSRAAFAKELYIRYQNATGGVVVPDLVRQWKRLDADGNPIL